MARTEARRIVLSGRVQGVGFRPFVYRTAHRLCLDGWVLNGSGQVVIHAEGEASVLDRFQQALIGDCPPLARPRLEGVEPAESASEAGFVIRPSEEADHPDIHVPPDLFTCDDCIGELTNPTERRYGYPFINCTQCGPRYTLITAMPYDRPNTSMEGFPLCDACREEYGSPLDRRFHAQPLACADCGPTLCFSQGDDRVEDNEAAIRAAVDALEQGRILAVKGVGGYHLLCDAASDDAVTRLRRRKKRPDKPLAVMMPPGGDDGLAVLRRFTAPTAAEAQAIGDPARPIVLVRMAEPFGLSDLLAPGLAELGVFLPYSPLHHRLLTAFGRPVVATSGNLSGEPVITAVEEAERRLSPICDAFLHHDRPIVRPADDPVIRVIGEAPQLIRPGRGVAPLELPLPWDAAIEPLVALGGHMKNAVGLAWDGRFVMSPHVGELDSPRSLEVFEQVIGDLQALYGVAAQTVIRDAHPGYASSRWAERQPLPAQRVWHHHAHASALAGEHAEVSDWLVFTWDGVGLGEDGSLWGGEALLGGPGRWRRGASLRSLRLLGGDRAGREPWRSAAAILWAEGVEWSPAIEGVEWARKAWAAGTGTHLSSAAGRIFDAASALVLGRLQSSFEGQGPMELESIAKDGAEPVALPLVADADGLLRSDWAPLLTLLANERVDREERASIFHATLAHALADQAQALASRHPVRAVGLSGGVFQNRLLSLQCRRLLEERGFDVRTHREVPANDAGLCYGQVIEVIGRAGHHG